MSSAQTTWSVYLIKCNNGSFYTGITTDINRRFSEHQGNSKGATFFRIHKPLEIREIMSCPNRSSAQKAEAKIKKLKKTEKQKLFETASY